MARVSFPADEPGGRLDSVVAARLGIPRADVQRAIAAGWILVDGMLKPKSFRLEGGELVEADIAPPGELEADPTPVAVLFEDDYLIAVSKPSGVVTHPTAARRTGTLVNRLIGMGVSLAASGDPDRPGIVHRLDGGTSGIMLVAKEDRAQAALKAMFGRHDLDRRYLALVRGTVPHDRFLIDAPLERRGPRIRVTPASGRKAATEARVVERLPGASLLEVRPRTGRTHQIRVHLAAVGHPVLGDRAYGGGGDDAAALGLVRPFLHSWRLAFGHPLTGERVELEDPLPEDLATALRAARNG